MERFHLPSFLKMHSEQQVSQSYVDILNLLANVVEGRDPYTAGHTWRVSQYARALASHLGWDQYRLVSIERAALFHDLGKIATEDRLLRKAGRLTQEEFDQIKLHPVEGRRLLQGIPLLQSAIGGIYAHHERYNGGGYPEGLRGEEIPAEGRLIAVADAFDALTSNRPYRRPETAEEALEFLETRKGILFDPEMVDAFLTAWEEGDLEKTVLHSEGHIPLLSCPVHGPTIAVNPKESPGNKVFCPVCKTRFVLIRIKGEWQAKMVQSREEE
ncbi:MAG: HD-GYP domain-containing protein [Nitrospirae bacterium]|nr:HD-GYP domain-containing protein [Nitrospirota bacterium]